MDSTSLSFDLSFGNLQDPEDLRTLARLGFRTLIDARAEADPPTSELGLRYVALPVSHADGPSEFEIGAFMKLMSDPDARPVFVRGDGERTGVLAVVWDAVYRALSLGDAEALARGLGVGPLSADAKAFIRAKSPVYRRSIALPSPLPLPTAAGPEVPLV